MALDSFIDKIPETDREAFKAEIGAYVPKTELEKYVPIEGIDKNPVFQSKLSIKHKESMDKFEAEKPKIIEEEIKKRGTKQPWEIEIEKLKSEAAEKDRMLTLRERKAQAQAELAKLGLDLNLSEFFLIEDEEKFKEKLTLFTSVTTTWKDGELKKFKESAFGQTTPKGGSGPGEKTLPREQFNALTPDKQRAFISEGGRPV